MSPNRFFSFSSQIPGNDLLFFGDSSYLRELVSFAEYVLQNLVDTIQQEPLQVTMPFTILLYRLTILDFTDV